MSKVPSADTTNTSLLTQLWNDSVRTFCSIRGGKWRFLENISTIATVASQQGYYVPARVRKIIDLYITVGSIIYTPTPVYDPEAWNLVLASRLAASDVPLFYYVQGNQVLIAPAPATSSNTITIRGRLNVRDLSIADATVTVTAVTNGDTAVTVSSGALASMAGKYLRITNNSAAAEGDGFWYEILSATPTATITLTAPYQGTTLAAASATATVGEMTPIPDAYDIAPIYRALALFSQINDPTHPSVSQAWWKLYDGGQEIGLVALPGGIVGQALQTEGETTEGAYIGPNRVRMVDPNIPPQNLTGF